MTTEQKVKEICREFVIYLHSDDGMTLDEAFDQWLQTPAAKKLIEGLEWKGGGMGWVKASERLQENDHEFVFLKGCRVDKGILRKEVINFKDHVTLYYNDGIGTQELTRWIGGHKELETIYWLDESPSIEQGEAKEQRVVKISDLTPRGKEQIKKDNFYDMNRPMDI